jgi:16S rRNA C1402 N4-methylase RsmH
MVIQEVLRVFGSANRMEPARRSFQAVKVGEVVRGTFIRNLQRALRDAEVMLDKPQNAAEVVAIVVDISDRCVRRNDNQGDAKPVLVVALPLIRHRQERGRLVVDKPPNRPK